MNEYNQPEQSGTETPAEAEVIPPTAPLADGWHYTANGFERFSYGSPVATATPEVIAANLNTARAEVVRLQTEQIDGSDPRLADFWAKAQELADKANHCEVFDNIAEALGGPRRTREYLVSVTGYVTVPVTYSYTIEAGDKDEAIEQAEEYFTSMDGSDLEDYADWYNADLDTYSTQYEADLN